MPELTQEQRDSFESWLTDRYNEMVDEEDFIHEEDPHLLPAIRAMLGLKQPRKVRRG